MTVRARTPSRRPICWSTCRSRTWPTTATPGHRHATGAPPFSSKAGSSCSLFWLVLAPFVLRYRAGDPVWNDMACGRRC